MDSSDWSNGIRYHTFDARSDTEFKRHQAFVLPPVCERENERGRNASACIMRRQAFRLALVRERDAFACIIRRQAFAFAPVRQ